MEILSLYDYLGHPAGKELGGKINKEAKRMGVSYRTKYVSNPKWKGNVHCYPRNFLDTYFGKTTEPPKSNYLDDLDGDLPF